MKRHQRASAIAYYEVEAKDLARAVILPMPHQVERWPFRGNETCEMNFEREVRIPHGERLARWSSAKGRQYHPRRTSYAPRWWLVSLDGYYFAVAWDDRRGKDELVVMPYTERFIVSRLSKDNTPAEALEPLVEKFLEQPAGIVKA